MDIAIRRIRAIALVAAIVLISPAVAAWPAHAEPSPADPGRDSVIAITGVEVNEARPENDAALGLNPGFARAYDVTRSHGRLRMVSDLLTGAVGVHVRQFGGIGAFSTASIRGSSSGQVAVYLDGAPLNSAQYGVVNLADFPIEALDRVEVYRGGAPLGFSSPGGGVINLIARRADATWLRAAVGRGSFETNKADLVAGWHRRDRSALVVGQYFVTDGSFKYFDDNATPFNADDDTLATRLNNHQESLALTGRVEQGLGPLSLALVHDHLSKKQGTPGTGANQALNATLRTDRDISNLLLRWIGSGPPAPETSLLTPTLRLYAVEQRDRFADPRGELTGLRQDNDDRTTRLGAALNAGREIVRGQVLSFVAEARQERYKPSIHLPAPRSLPESERRFWVAGTEARSSLLRERVAFTGSVRRQITDDQLAGGPPYPGALPVPASDRTTYQTAWTVGSRVALLGGVAAKGSVSHLARMPTLEELFGDRAGIYGNPRAKPEDIRTWDTGLVGLWSFDQRSSRVLPAWIETQFSGYRSEATDLLVFIQNSVRSSVAQNISAAHLEGLEASVRSSWSAGVSVDLSWTRQWTRDEGEVVYWNGKELPGHPRDEGAMRLSLARTRWRGFYEIHHASSSHLDRYNASVSPGRTLHDLGLSWSPWGYAYEWSAEVRNLTDQRVEDFAGYPLPGRMFYVGMRLRLERKENHP